MPNQITLWMLWVKKEIKLLQDAWTLYQWYRNNKNVIDAAKNDYEWFRNLWPF